MHAKQLLKECYKLAISDNNTTIVKCSYTYLAAMIVYMHYLWTLDLDFITV